jgi:hypothetical protein
VVRLLRDHRRGEPPEGFRAGSFTHCPAQLIIKEKKTDLLRKAFDVFRVEQEAGLTVLDYAGEPTDS